MPSDIAELSAPFKLEMYAIYKHPKDHPNNYVVRRWENETPKELVGLASTLDLARELIPPGLYNIRRRPTDDPVIVEVWI